MKKIVALILLCSLMIVLFGCSNSYDKRIENMEYLQKQLQEESNAVQERIDALDRLEKLVELQENN